MVRLDMTAAGFAVAVSVTVALLLAALQARRVGSGDLAGLLRSGGRGVAGSSVRLRRGLVVLEVALSVVLLACTGVLLRSVRTLLAQDLGVPTEGMVATRLVLPNGRYGDAGGAAFFASLETAVRALPGVETTALVSNPPVSPGRGSMSRVRIKGREELAVGEAQPVATAMAVGPDAMQNLGLRLLRGRLIDGGDGPGAPLVVVIDELMARRYWPGTDPLGQEIRFLRTDGPWHTVVGVVAPARWDGLDAANPTFYSAYRQTPTWAPRMSDAMTLVVRARLGAAATADLLRAAVRDLDPLLPVRRIDSIATLTSRALGERRILLVLLTSFAGLALLLAAVGVFALQAFLVASTSGEIAVRLSLGATPRRVVVWVLGASGRLLVAGIAIGCLAAVGAGRFLSAYLYQVRPHDPWTLAVVALVVGAAGLSASALPARRAAAVDPAATLRQE
jgi:putative ABC transport system permease protein